MLNGYKLQLNAASDSKEEIALEEIEDRLSLLC